METIFSHYPRLRRFDEWTMGYAQVGDRQVDLLNLQCDGNEDPDQILKEFEYLAVSHQMDLLVQNQELILETP